MPGVCLPYTQTCTPILDASGMNVGCKDALGCRRDTDGCQDAMCTNQMDAERMQLGCSFKRLKLAHAGMQKGCVKDAVIGCNWIYYMYKDTR